MYPHRPQSLTTNVGGVNDANSRGSWSQPINNVTVPAEQTKRFFVLSLGILSLIIISTFQCISSLLIRSPQDWTAGTWATEPASGIGSPVLPSSSQRDDSIYHPWQSTKGNISEVPVTNSTIQSDWNNAGNDSVGSSIEYHSGHRRKVVIAQYSGMGPYSVLLNLTSPINQWYAQRWGYDYYALRGPPPSLSRAWERRQQQQQQQQMLRVQQQQGTLSNPQPAATFPPSRATYFKLFLLESALMENHYDYLVLLDSDALFYDFDRDILSVMPNEQYLLAAHRVHATDVPYTGNVNIGVTIWNLRHPNITWVLQEWKEACLQRMRNGGGDDDQTPLQEVLRYRLSDAQRKNMIAAVREEFYYGKGTLVKHFIRLDHHDWSTDSLERRLQKIGQVWIELCPRYQLPCSNLISMGDGSQ